MASRLFYFYRTIPFIRILLPFIIGIASAWYGQYPRSFWFVLTLFAITPMLLLRTGSIFQRFRFVWIYGVCISILLYCLGGWRTWLADPRHDTRWVGHHSTGNEQLVAITLTTVPVEKEKSFRANAAVNYIIKSGKPFAARGTIIVYFTKDTGDKYPAATNLTYGTRILLKASIHEIKSMANPGGFDYRRYCFLQGITHQVFLRKEAYTIAGYDSSLWFQRLFYPAQEGVLDILRQYIPDQTVLGMAEALLIGYKDDLDKTLVQAYSNTGVVHVIAISGLHIGLVYGLLVLLLKPLARYKYIRWLRPVIIIAGLWAFSLLAGGQPSVLRSAVMFTCIVLGQQLPGQGNIYNSLAFSAFILLCYNPYWLWDAGFQLSYTAVLSIIIFMKPVYHCFFIKNKLLDFVWKLNAVTLSAQLLTVPVSIYHFHQFPVYFLLTNLLAVPLSSIVVLVEIGLCAFWWYRTLALFLGRIITWLIVLMNNYVSRIDMLPYAVAGSMSIDVIQMFLLYQVIAGAGHWVIQRSGAGLIIALVGLSCFCAVRCHSFITAGKQKKIIVYNVPGHIAIDVFSGRECLFISDTVPFNESAAGFYLRPSRILHRIKTVVSQKTQQRGITCIRRGGLRIMIVSQDANLQPGSSQVSVDILIVTGNPRLYINQLTETFTIKNVVFATNVPKRKLAYWKKDCDSLGISYHDISEKGAFVMILN